MAQNKVKFQLARYKNNNRKSTGYNKYYLQKETHGDGSGEHLYAANIITFFRISKFSVEKMLIGTVPPILLRLGLIGNHVAADKAAAC